MIIDPLSLLSRWLHVLSAILIVGGFFFLWAVLLPATRPALSEENHQRLQQALSRRWRILVHTSMALLLLSGFYNYLVVALPQHRGQPLYHALFGIKFLLALAVFGLAVILTSSREKFATWRAQSPKWLAILVALSVTVVMIGSVLRALPKTLAGN